jgi:CRP-like cAMP-binding protein
MAEQLQKQIISMATRQQLILGLPCFSEFTAEESRVLAKLLVEQSIASGDKIVNQDDLVDNVYIIASGTAEVSRKFACKRKLSKKLKVFDVPIAILSEGEAIGLNDRGFFSETGKRTATVTAVTKMVLLMIHVKTLHGFFQLYPNLMSSMDKVAEKLLRMQLIKQSLPFSHLTGDRLHWLVDHITEISVSAGALIFSQGDVGDRCYLICSGEVGIVARDEDGQERHLTTLKSPTLFGEATLITHAPRNASARALTDCQLLELRYEYLAELLESEGNTAEMFMTLMVDRSRPLRSPDVSEHHRLTADHQDIIILKNSRNGAYFKLSPEGLYIWQHLDGKQTLQEITLDLANNYNIFSPEMVAGLISKLAKSGFLQNLEVIDELPLAKQSFWIKGILRLRRILEAKIAIGNANQWLTKWYNKIGYLFFTKLGLVVLSILAVGGVLAFVFSTQHVIHLFRSVHASWVLFILLIPCMMISVALHELGHAFATKYNGYEVQYMGVGWYWFGPVAFTDTSDMWLSARWPRIMVNLAGIYSDIINAGVAAILIFVIPNAYVQCFLWLFALYTYINAFRMLSPLQDLDGYYVLMDIFDRTRLRHAAVTWLVKDFPKAVRQPELFKGHMAELCYWLACIIYLVLVTLLTWLVQDFVLRILGIHSVNQWVGLVLPFFVVIISSVNIIADIRSQSE